MLVHGQCRFINSPEVHLSTRSQLHTRFRRTMERKHLLKQQIEIGRTRINMAAGGIAMRPTDSGCRCIVICTLFTCSTISRYSGKGSRPLSTSPSSHPTLQLRTDAPDDLLDRPMSYTFNERAVVAGRLRNCLRTPATALVGLKQKWNDGHLRGTMIITSHLC